MISVDTDILKQLADAAQSADEKILAASEVIHQITVHNDWGCKERESINELIQKCRTQMKILQESSHGFSGILSQVMEEFVREETSIGDMFESVESILADMIQIVVPVANGTYPLITDRGSYSYGIPENVLDIIKNNENLNIVNFEEILEGIK